MVVDVSDRILSIESSAGLSDNLGHPESLVQLRSFLQTPGVVGTPLAAELSHLLPDMDGPLLASRGWKEMAHRLRDLLTGPRIEVVEESVGWLPLEVHLLYRPQVPGATASLSVTSEEEDVEVCKLEFFGTGGGAEHVVRLAVSDELKTDSDSMAAVYQLQSTWEQCHMSQPDGTTSSFMRLKSVDRSCQRIEVRNIDEGEAKPTWGQVVDRQSFDLRQASGSLSRTLSIEKGSKWEGVVGVSLESLGLNCEARFQGTRSWKSEFSFELVSGYLYEALRFESGAHWWWTAGS